MSNRFWHVLIAVYLLLVVLFAGELVVMLFGDPVAPPKSALDDAKDAKKGEEGKPAVKKEGAGDHYAITWFPLCCSPDPAGGCEVNQDVRLLLISIAMGALGSVVHALTSLADYVGNHRFRPRWLLWYALRPWIGSVLAGVLYFVLRGGLLTAADGDSVNAFGIAAVCGMTGMFSKQAADKLEEVFTTLLQTKSGADARRADKLGDKTGHKTLAILEVRPPILEKGLDNKIEIVGQGFEAGLQVNFAGALLTPTLVEAERVEVTVVAAQLQKAGTASVFVVAKSGAQSEAITVEVA